MGSIQFDFKPYRRPFRSPLKTTHGEWSVREGIILRLMGDQGTVGFGEIAPIPWFGTETLEQALEFCRQLPLKVNVKAIAPLPTSLPACQFGFESAITRLKEARFAVPSEQWKFPPSAICSALLPPGEAAVQAWIPLWNQGYRTFKYKLGVYPIQDEMTKIVSPLIQALPCGARLRLDANGGLSFAEAEAWLQFSAELASDSVQSPCGQIEFLEQPLPPAQFDDLLKLAERHVTPIALDESVATLEQLQTCYDRGWRGIFVIKPAIAGSPGRLRQFCQEMGIDGVVSSVLETAIGQQAAIDLVAHGIGSGRAIGFGIDHWFPDNDPLRSTDAEELWKHL
ncbi:o-succinylbenzoate synthase [Leptothermofonsia sp. ETS-13]|uniref:o-succinylbenzoate synthase n=1 Tax=Leptothermofonsia sp. ETS-13 TaxID=3035696 RepID=UPI003BA01F46